MAATALVAVALGGVATAAADVVPGTEDGWGHPPGGVMLTVDGDDGSGNHTLTLTWGNIDPVLKDDGYWLCAVTERSTTTRKGTEGSNSGSVIVSENANYSTHFLVLISFFCKFQLGFGFIN